MSAIHCRFTHRSNSGYLHVCTLPFGHQGQHNDGQIFWASATIVESAPDAPSAARALNEIGPDWRERITQPVENTGLPSAEPITVESMVEAIRKRWPSQNAHGESLSDVLNALIAAVARQSREAK